MSKRSTFHLSLHLRFRNCAPKAAYIISLSDQFYSLSNFSEDGSAILGAPGGSGGYAEIALRQAALVLHSQVLTEVQWRQGRSADVKEASLEVHETRIDFLSRIGRQASSSFRTYFPVSEDEFSLRRSMDNAC